MRFMIFKSFSLWLLSWLRDHKPGRIAGRYQVEEQQEAVHVLEDICRKRGLLLRGGEPDLEKGGTCCAYRVPQW